MVAAATADSWREYAAGIGQAWVAAEGVFAEVILTIAIGVGFGAAGE